MPSARAPQIVLIQAQAPTKPPTGQPCNGCGLCCLAEPCPVGMLLSRRRHGACSALRWCESELHYRCGALQWRAPHPLLSWLQRPLRAWMARMIAAGQGCDAELLPQPVDERSPPPSR